MLSLRHPSRDSDPIAFNAALNHNECAVRRTHERHSPHFGFGVEKANRRADASLFRTFPWIGDPYVLQRTAIDDPAEFELAWSVSDGAVLGVEAEIAIPGADQAIEDSCFVSE